MRISASLFRSVDNETIIDVILKAGVGRGIWLQEKLWSTKEVRCRI